MKWVTRKQIRVNRLATAWLIQRFVDKEPEFLFVEPDQVASVQQSQDAIGFDAPGAKYAHDKGITSFEQIIQDYELTDSVLAELAQIVHAADIPGAIDQRPEANGLKAISHGFPLVTTNDDETLQKAFFIYDSLYAYLQARHSTNTLPKSVGVG
ncbi:chromate resistance protein [Tolypothrix sp. PCC 7910]|uniref:chromate resistance protein ChrB domain-containing protein n=1 Tax=Tolypothrix sp. PCC 7910 TaxID=2099387 RepID=UPI0014279F4A|nr:chromate resistance protein ChrB domain-containing protein [Tolypothrix sp. PCC 7910]QIR37188.1 chromate resistance protein [Tolypothrix sp. PCC 7910]